MEGNAQPQNYLTEDINVHYDDIIDPSWTGAGTPYGYQPQNHLGQDPYSHAHYNQQATYDQYASLQQHQHQHQQQQQQQQQPQQQPAYPQLPFNSPYSNSPYQQHTDPTNVYRGSPYSAVETSLAQSTPYQSLAQNQPSGAFPYSPQENTTIAPRSLQYSASSGQIVNRSVSNNPYQQSSINSPSQEPFVNNNIPQNGGSSAQYHALPQGVQAYGSGALNANGLAQHVSPYSANISPSSTHSTKITSVPTPSAITPSIAPPLATPPPVTTPPSATPPPTNTQSTNTASFNTTRSQPQYARDVVDQGALRITHPDLLASGQSPSRQSLPNAPYMFWDTEAPVQVAPGLKNTIPKFQPRKSRSGLDLLPGAIGSKIPARPIVKRNRVSKEPKILSKKLKSTTLPKQVVSRVTTLREGVPSSIKSPTPTETSSSEDESSSEEEESEYEDEPVVAPIDISSVRSLLRPIDSEAAAASWDAIGIVWKDPNSNPSAAVIKSAIEEYGNFVSAIRVKLKTNATQMEEAASRPDDLAKVKKARADLLEALYQTVDSANRLGYPAVVENLGNHHKLVNGLTTTLIDCSKVNDYAGKLPKAIFSMLSRFQTMSDELLKKVKFDAIEKRWLKKNDDKDIKKDIAAVRANTTDSKAKAAKLKKEPEELEANKKLDQTKLRNTNINGSIKPTSIPTSTKRPHEPDLGSTKPNKKFASDVAGAATKPVPAKRPAFSSNLLGISTKPVAKPIPKKREPSPPHVSALGALLASIAKEPEAPKVPDAPARAPETEEERKRRERKESRRHLRVRFREGPELEEVRLFRHEQAEDEGRQDNMLKDAHDDRSEGMMHKKRVSENLDGNIEDEEAPADNMDERPYPSHLIKLDLGNIPKATSFGPTYVTRGGNKTFTTPEQQIQEQREASELMVVYTDPKDIPSTPKEPPQGDTIHLDQEHQLRGPSEAWVTQRLQEIQHYGPDYATEMFLKRNEEQKLKSAQKHGADINSVLKQLGDTTQNLGVSSSALSNQTSQVPLKAMDSAAWDSLLATIQMLKGKPFPPIEPPEWMTVEASRAEWWAGYYKDEAIKKAAVDAQAAQQAVQFQPPAMIPIQPVPQPQMQQYTAQVAHATQPIMTAVPSQSDDVTQQVQAYLAGLYNGQPINGQPLPNANTGTDTSYQQYDLSGWSAGNGKAQAKDSEWDNDNTRYRSKQNQDSHNSNSKQRGYDMKTWTDGPLDANGEYKGKKKPCRFWGIGKCAKGAKCTFLHDE